MGPSEPLAIAPLDADTSNPANSRSPVLQVRPESAPSSAVIIEGYVLLNGKSCEKNMTDTNDFWPVAKTFVVSGRPGRWRELQVLGTDIEGDQQSESTTAGFVRLRDGRFAIEYYVRSFDGGSGCEGRGSTIYGVNRSKLKVIEDLPDPIPCAEQ
jgi:hypothetical protein